MTDPTPPGVPARKRAKRAPDASGIVLVQIGWMNPKTGVVCDCPVYERSPHANSVPVYREVKA